VWVVLREHLPPLITALEDLTPGQSEDPQ